MMLALMSGKLNFGVRRVSTSVRPWSNSWLPSVETSTPMALRASIVGWSFAMNDVNVVAPTLSPALATIVFGFAARICLATVASTAAPPDGLAVSRRPWKSLNVITSMTVGSAAAAGIAARGPSTSPPTRATTDAALKRRSVERFTWRLLFRGGSGTCAQLRKSGLRPPLGTLGLAGRSNPQGVCG